MILPIFFKFHKSLDIKSHFSRGGRVTKHSYQYRVNESINKILSHHGNKFSFHEPKDIFEKSRKHKFYDSLPIAQRSQVQKLLNISR